VNASRKEALKFQPKIKPISSKAKPKASSDYKAVRAKELKAMAKEYGLEQHAELLVAHLLRECGSMTEFCDWKPGKKSNDNGWAFGVAQWHLCYREWDWLKANDWAYYDAAGRKQCRWNIDITKVRAKYFKEHPAMTTWQGQAKRYLTEMRDNVPKKGSVTAVIDSWNANPAYMGHVRAQLPNARFLLSL
jgi:hypothetical protein